MFDFSIEKENNALFPQWAVLAHVEVPGVSTISNSTANLVGAVPDNLCRDLRF